MTIHEAQYDTPADVYLERAAEHAIAELGIRATRTIMDAMMTRAEAQYQAAAVGWLPGIPVKFQRAPEYAR